jgi:tripartite-type tricarboxylate transporter receptor subunit TctC
MRWRQGMAAASAMLLAGVGAFAQSGYPDRPIRILVGFSAGVAPDV